MLTMTANWVMLVGILLIQIMITIMMVVKILIGFVQASIYDKPTTH